MAVGDTTELIRSIRRHTHIPAAHPSYTDELTLVDATEELRSYLLPLGLVERQELWAGPVGRLQFPLTNTPLYAIPPRAVGGKIRSARLLDSTGTPTYLSTYGREQVAQVRDTGGVPTGLTVEGSFLRLYPTPRNLPGWVLELEIYVRPAALVPRAATAPIQSVSPGSGSTTFRVTRTTANEDLFSAEWLDVVAGAPPFDYRAFNVAVVSVANVSGSTWEVVLDTEFDAAAQDYLCLPEQAPVVQAPLEWHPLLALKTAARQLASLGDLEAVQAKGAEGAQKEKQAPSLIRPRRDDVARKPRNGMNQWRGGGAWGY